LYFPGSSVGHWVIWDGPQHVKSLAPLLNILEQDLKDVLENGVIIEWSGNHEEVMYKSENYTMKRGDKIRIHATIGICSGDQPAQCLVNGHAGHSAKRACRCTMKISLVCRVI